MTALLESVRAAAEAQYEWEQHPGREEGDTFVAAAVNVDFVRLLRDLTERRAA